MQRVFAYLAVSANHCKSLDEIAHNTGLDRLVLTAHVARAVQEGHMEKVKTADGTGYQLKETD